jgi:hypothetical protein
MKRRHKTHDGRRRIEIKQILSFNVHFLQYKLMPDVRYMVLDLL